MNRSAHLDQQRLTEATFVVMDFETVTPPKRPPEPIELAAMRIITGLHIDEQFHASWFIKPPDGAPLTPFDTRQTGIRWENLYNKPSATAILQEFETLVCSVLPAVLVAHNASYEANIVWRFAESCPTLAALPFVDTVELAKQLIPNLHSYRLNTLAQYFSLPIPSNRHRALPDVQLTIQIFLRLVHLYQEKKPAATVADLKRLAGIHRKERLTAQMCLFDEN